MSAAASINFLKYQLKQHQEQPLFDRLKKELFNTIDSFRIGTYY